jgi:hypothetical protein
MKVINYSLIKIPTLIVHGENDTKFQSAVEVLKRIPSSEVLIIKNASHACYVQRPIEFHNGLRQFLYTVYRPIYIEQYKKRSESLTNTSSLLSSVKSEKTNSSDNENNDEEKVVGNLTSNKNKRHTH